MECEKVRNHFADHLAGDLPPLIQREVDEHVAACESCRLEAHGLGHLWTKLGAIAVEPPDSDSMWARFESMMEVSPEASPVLRSAVRRWFLRPAFQLGFAVVLLVIGILLGRGSRVSLTAEVAPEIEQMRVELGEMKTQMLVLSLMQQQSASERLRGVNWSNQLGQPDSPVLTALLATLMRDPNINVRVACVSALEKFGEQQVVRRGLVEALGYQDSPLVQAALIDAVLALRETESVDTLRRLTLDVSVDEKVRKLAERALQQLS
jgi:hypothetical protein